VLLGLKALLPLVATAPDQPPLALQLTGDVAVLLIDQLSVTELPLVIVVDEALRLNDGATGVGAGAGVGEGEGDGVGVGVGEEVCVPVVDDEVVVVVAADLVAADDDEPLVEDVPPFADLLPEPEVCVVVAPWVLVWV
jgi:hypothetical protein